MSEKEREVILGQAPETITSFFTGPKSLRGNYQNKFVVTEDAEQPGLIADIGQGHRLHGSIVRENGRTKNLVLGGGEILLWDRSGGGQELLLCGSSKNYGPVPEAVAAQIGERVREVLLAGNDKKEIVITIRNLIGQINSRFTELGF